MSDLNTFISYLKKNNKEKILLYIHADWCDKCKIDVNKIKNIKLHPINIDKNNDLVDILDVRVLPYFMLVSYDFRKNDLIVHETFNNPNEIYEYKF